MDCINIIKTHYFSQDNYDFILHLLYKRHIHSEIINEITFRARNEIYNGFINTISIKKKTINPNSIEELLVTLNKMTIEAIINEIDNPSQFKKYKTSENKNYTKPEKSHSQSQSTQPVPSKNFVKHNQPKDTDVKITDSCTTESCKPESCTPESCTPDSKILVKVNMVPDLYLPGTELVTQKKKSVVFFSNDIVCNNGEYIFQLNDNKETQKSMEKTYKSVPTIKELSIKNFELYNNLYNITEYNNKIELCENSLKLNIVLSTGCYDLASLVEHINIQFNEKSEKLGRQIKYECEYNKRKNRINIRANNKFNFRFIENVNNFIPLRFLLGFSDNEYMNNDCYISDNDPVVNIYDSIYLSIKTDDNSLNTISASSNFEYYCKINMDYLNTFCNNVICIGSCVERICNSEENIKSIKIEFYYRHNIHNKFYKITKNLLFNFHVEF